MKTPMSEKSPQMRKAIEDLFPGTANAISQRKCPICATPITSFRNALSLREYEISGMCQKCQDTVFSER
jgi:hydrogenase maturation factor